MEQTASVELRKNINEWRKPTFAKDVRAMEVGQSIQIEKDYLTRQSRYVNAKKSFPEAKFSVRKQSDGTFLLIRIA